jgi:hypothetical protein
MPAAARAGFAIFGESISTKKSELSGLLSCKGRNRLLLRKDVLSVLSSGLLLLGETVDFPARFEIFDA